MKGMLIVQTCVHNTIAFHNHFVLNYNWLCVASTQLRLFVAWDNPGLKITG